MRGAPAIAIVGCLSLAVELTNNEFQSLEELKDFVEEKLDYLVTSRPTAVNMGDAAAKGKAFVRQLVKTGDCEPEDAKLR